MNKKERMLFAFGDINDKFVKEAEPNPMASKKRIISIAASLAIIVALSLYLFIPYSAPRSNLEKYEGSSYYPLIEKLDPYRLSLMRPKHKNNFGALIAVIENMFPKKGDMAPGDAGPDMMENSPNGEYIESTDNQVAGVIESDLMKMTDKYIFRLGYRHDYSEEDKYATLLTTLNIYTIAGEDSKLVTSLDISAFADQTYAGYDTEMYLSPDGNRITLVKPYRSGNVKKLGIISLDVSDVANINESARVSIDGELNTTRMVDGKLLVVSDYAFNLKTSEYDKPETFVPTIDRGAGAECIEFDDIIYPDLVTDSTYTVVALLDSENLEILGAKALLNFTNNVYISENNVFITHEYVKRIENENNKNEYESSNVSDIAVLGYRGETLGEEVILTVDGHAEDQYSFDEYDGHLRVVTSTLRTKSTQSEDYEFQYNVNVSRNAALYVFNLESYELVASVTDFAPDGEQSTAVRFDGDSCYVCTAVVVNFTDPVFFFDLSDYENITYTDTGIIEGYSDHLINYGEGQLLGIGRENWQYSKVEVYEDLGGKIVGVYKFKFDGTYSLDYKSYLVNREENLFGFGVNYFYEYDEETQVGRGYNCYVLISFDDTEMTVQKFKIDSLQAEYVRAAYIDGYLYVTTQDNLVVEKID